jgi:uncharacterized OB-fold protein
MGSCPIESLAGGGRAAYPLSVMMTCPACGVELEPGFVPDFGSLATWVAVWVPGEPSASKSAWERAKTGAGVSLGGADAKAIDAHRCPRCGRLELYATRAPAFGSTPAARAK